RLRRELDVPPAVRVRRDARRARRRGAEERRARLAVARAALRDAQPWSSPVPRLGLLERGARRHGSGADRRRVRRHARAVAGRGAGLSGLDIAGGRVLDPGRGIDATATVSIPGGVITGVDVTGGGDGARGLAGDRQVIDAAGLLVIPGLVDVHTH